MLCESVSNTIVSENSFCRTRTLGIYGFNLECMVQQKISISECRSDYVFFVV